MRHCAGPAYHTLRGENMITINKEKCAACGKCVAVCPTRNIRMVDGRAYWNPKRRCIECLHCAAICNFGAVEREGKPALVARGLPKTAENVAQDLEAVLYSRRSYRSFSQKPVDRELLEHALEISKWAPSAKNEHPVKWVVVAGRGAVDRVMGLILDYVRETGNAPEIAKRYDAGYNMVTGTAVTLLVGYAGTDAYNPMADTALAIDYAELVLQANGIGSCWGGYLTRMVNTIPELSAMFGIGEGEKAYGALMLGYPEGEEYVNIPNRVYDNSIRWVAED